MIRRVLLLAVLAASMVVGGLLAVSASGRSAHAAKTGKVSLKASEKSGKLRFNKKTIRLRHGTVKFTLSNPSGNSLPHGLEVTRSGVEKKTRTLSPGGKGSVTVRLKRGTYKFYCPVDGHRQAGMKGVIVVS